MQISVPVQRGASGGPVLDQAGNLIGVVVLGPRPALLIRNVGLLGAQFVAQYCEDL